MRLLWRLVANLFSWAWRIINFIREATLNLMLVVLVLIGIVIYGFLKPESPEVKQGALLLDLSGVIVEEPRFSNPIQQMGREFFGNNSSITENSVFDLVDAIRQAKTDSKVKGIVLYLNNLTSASAPSITYIGKALQEFKESGKPVYAYADTYSQSQYYLASYASKVFMSPQGSVDLNGLGMNALYYKDLLEKLKVNTHVFRVGTYKSAVEPFIRNDMSAEARENTQRWVDLMWQNIRTDIATNRKLHPNDLVPDADTLLADLKRLGGDSAAYALQRKLVDQLTTRQEMSSAMAKEFGEDKTPQGFIATNYQNYLSANPLDRTPADGNIGVIIASGAIMDGVQQPGSIGGDSTAELLRQARTNSKIKAVVLRVDSPGGSAFASEIIRNEVVALEKAGKPVVISMGSMAASGGYWISADASYIIANPNTITGSIGIFGVINTFENTLNSIGVNTDGVSTGPLADLSITKKLNPHVTDLIQLSIERGYQQFLTLVAQGRKMTIPQVDSIAQGQVWLGVDAKQKGLVDALGDFDTAVTKAAELAKLKTPQLNWVQQSPSTRDLILSQFSVQIQALMPAGVAVPAPLMQTLKAWQQQTSILSEFNDPNGRYAYCLNCGQITR
ncbi:MAG: signal peptide peptidase SppA [Plesiomonas sp.]|uniref:signal peptide peptidase SppA n=1 Tax=Plesiomonas sp. TaxID=2486279 RepID=UPI003F33F246